MDQHQRNSASGDEVATPCVFEQHEVAQNREDVNLQYTGERHMTDQIGLTLHLGHIDHMVRYAFVSPHIQGKRVLDISCGSGYGTQFMAIQGANQVVGVDIDPASIEYALKYHKYESVTYIQSDAHSVPQLEDASFDVIVSFETIEHLQYPRDFLLELRRLLKPNGQCFISCPNDYRTSPWISEFHLHKFRFDEFRDLVTNTFGEAIFLGQHNTTTSSLIKPVPISEKATQFGIYKQPTSPEVLGNQYLEDIASIENAAGYFAVIGVDPSLIVNQVSISEKAFYQVMSSFSTAVEQKKSMELELIHTRQLQSDLSQTQGHLDFARNQVAQLQHDLSQAEGNLDFARNQVAQLQHDLSQTNEHLVIAQNESSRLQSELTETQQYLHQIKIQLQQLQQQSDQRIEQLTSKLQKKQNRLLNLRSQLERSQAQIQEMESSKFWKLKQQWSKIKQSLLSFNKS